MGNKIESENHANYSPFMDTRIEAQRAADDRTIAVALEILETRLRAKREHSDSLEAPAAASAYLRLKLAAQEREVFACLFLDTRHRVIEYRELFYGTIGSATVHPREVVKAALTLNAAAVILAHNHPSGVAEPSHADATLTRKLMEACATVDIRVLDHLVIGEGEAVSMAQRGLM